MSMTPQWGEKKEIKVRDLKKNNPQNSTMNDFSVKGGLQENTKCFLFHIG